MQTHPPYITQVPRDNLRSEGTTLLTVTAVAILASSDELKHCALHCVARARVRETLHGSGAWFSPEPGSRRDSRDPLELAALDCLRQRGDVRTAD